jgi:hypothetical protein
LPTRVTHPPRESVTYPPLRSLCERLQSLDRNYTLDSPTFPLGAMQGEEI